MNPDQQLFDGWLRGELDAEGKRRLATLLADDARSREFVAYCLETGLLVRAASSILPQEPTSARITPVSGRQPVTGEGGSSAFHRSRRGRQRPRRPDAGPLALLLAAALLVVVGALVLFGAWSRPQGAQEGLEGDAIAVIRSAADGWLRHDGQRVPLRADLPVRRGDVVEAGSGAEGAVVSWRGEDTELQLSPGSEARIGVPEAPTRIVLQRGRIDASVAHQGPGRRLEFDAGSARFTVIGTRLAISLEGSAATLDVSEGLVRAEDTSASRAPVEVAAGERVTITPGGRIAVARRPVAEPASDGLVGWWDFEDMVGGIAVDRSGHGHDGRMVGVASVPGRIGKAIAVDGRGHVVVEGADDLGPSERGFTMCAWIQVRAPSVSLFRTEPQNVYMFELGSDTDRKKLGSTLQFGWRADVKQGMPSSFIGSAAATLPLGRWSHVALVSTRTTSHAYVDGKRGPAMQGQFPAQPGAFRQCRWYMGAFAPDPTEVFYGSIDEVRMYDRALSTDEIIRLARQ